MRYTGIVNSFRFNNRFQPATLWSSSPTQTLMYLVYDFHLGNGNNRNVYGITNNRRESGIVGLLLLSVYKR
jgi:hypothetical protein